MVTLHLSVCAPEIYPDRRAEGRELTPLPCTSTTRAWASSSQPLHPWRIKKQRRMESAENFPTTGLLLIFVRGRRRGSFRLPKNWYCASPYKHKCYFPCKRPASGNVCYNRGRSADPCHYNQRFALFCGSHSGAAKRPLSRIRGRVDSGSVSSHRGCAQERRD